MPAPCWSSTTASTSSTRAPTWRTRCSPTARSCGSWRPSREPLGITGESLFVVPPLDEDPAVRLFADRAAAVRPDFSLDSESRPLVIDIVRRLDGLPLAIELAAARLRTLPLAEISRRLTDRFRLLTGGSRTALPRHRTLRAVVEWSWELLTPAERLLAERFSVFPAGATPPSPCCARRCAGAELTVGEADELLSSLVDKSLLQPLVDGTRLRMLETIREYGAEKLAGRGEVGELGGGTPALHRADADAAPRLLTRDQLSWLARCGDGQHPRRAALLVRRGRRTTPSAWRCAQRHGAAARHADIAEWTARPSRAGERPGLRAIAEALHVVTSV